MLGLSGCYVIQAAHGEMQVLDRRRPLRQVIADPRTPQGLRGTLEEVLAARNFASGVLDLPDNKSYRTYADIGRAYVVWNVVATPEFSVRPLHWCFPVAGCVSYRGYFKESRARRFAARLRGRGYDVLVDGVPAYSTLGRFADPVLSSMLPYGNAELAAIIFHELAHQVVYVRDDSSFNEAFATTVEREGLKRWLLHEGRTAELERMEAASARELEYLALFRSCRTDLAVLYASDVPPAEMRARKRERLERLGRDILALEAREHVHSLYDEWIEQGLNNADLASLATYYDCVPGFERVLAEEHGSLPLFYAAVRRLAREPRHTRDASLCTTPTAPLPGATSARGTAAAPGDGTRGFGKAAAQP